MSALFAWMETTPVADAIRNSLLMTAALSSIHLLGFTMVTGGALVANLRLLGVLFPGRPLAETATPTDRGIALGLCVSLATGLLLFSARATTASESSTFQIKMLFLASAVLFHFTLHRRLVRRAMGEGLGLRLAGALGLLLWVGLAVAACVYILFE